jgi:glycosyltransferase involved in cell wall biosynthesis
LRLVFVGSLDLRKGFVYLLRAMRELGPERVHLHLAGATGDSGSRRLFERERQGLSITLAPGDPIAPYHQSELMVLPSLEDGFGFVTAEAMACGLPVVVTDQCGSQELVTPGKTGWITPAASVAALVGVFETALRSRDQLQSMGRECRVAMERHDPFAIQESIAAWFEPFVEGKSTR